MYFIESVISNHWLHLLVYKLLLYLSDRVNKIDHKKKKNSIQKIPYLAFGNRHSTGCVPSISKWKKKKTMLTRWIYICSAHWSNFSFDYFQLLAWDTYLLSRPFNLFIFIFILIFQHPSDDYLKRVSVHNVYIQCQI